MTGVCEFCQGAGQMASVFRRPSLCEELVHFVSVTPGRTTDLVWGLALRCRKTEPDLEVVSALSIDVLQRALKRRAHVVTIPPSERLVGHLPAMDLRVVPSSVDLTQVVLDVVPRLDGLIQPIVIERCICVRLYPARLPT